MIHLTKIGNFDARTLFSRSLTHMQ